MTPEDNLDKLLDELEAANTQATAPASPAPSAAPAAARPVRAPGQLPRSSNAGWRVSSNDTAATFCSSPAALRPCA